MANRQACILVLMVCLTILARNALVQADNDPEQIHLSLGTDESEMIVTWNTRHHTGHHAYVHYGTDPNDLSQNAVGETTHFEEGHTHFYVHRVLLTGLKLGTEYYYQVGSKAGWSATYHFRTLQSGSDWLPHFAIYGDLGLENGLSLPYLVRDVENDLYDVLFHIGDFAYDLNSHNGKRGDKFMNDLEPIASRRPYMTCPGNHDEHANFSHYDARFSMLGDRFSQYRHSSVWNRLNNHFWSVDIGPTHIIMYSTEYYYFTKNGWSQIRHQYEWLEADLKRANENRQQRPWIIAMGHRPFYCIRMTASSDCDTEHEERRRIRKGVHYKDDRDSNRQYGLEELFYRYGVDLQFFGHDHYYARLLPVYDFEAKPGRVSQDNPYDHPEAPVLIFTGSAGNWEAHYTFSEHLKPWVGAHFYDYGYTRLRFHSREHIILEQISDDQDGAIADRIDLIKRQPFPVWMTKFNENDNQVEDDDF